MTRALTLALIALVIAGTVFAEGGKHRGDKGKGTVKRVRVSK